MDLNSMNHARQRFEDADAYEVVRREYLGSIRSKYETVEDSITGASLRIADQVFHVCGVQCNPLGVRREDCHR